MPTRPARRARALGKRPINTANAATSPDVSANNNSVSLLNQAPVFSGNMNAEGGKVPPPAAPRPSKVLDAQAEHPHVAPPGGRRSRTPLGFFQTFAPGGDDIQIDAGVAPSTLPSAITVNRAPRATSPNASKRNSAPVAAAAAGRASYPSDAVRRARPTTVSEPSTLTQSRHPKARNLLLAKSRSQPQPQPRARSATLNISYVRPRASIASHTTDSMRVSDTYTPTASLNSISAPAGPALIPAVTSAAEAPNSGLAPQSLVPPSPSPPPQQPAPLQLHAQQRMSGGGPVATHVLVTPRPSLLNEEDMSHLTPIKPAAAAAAATAAATTATASPPMPRATWGGAPTLGATTAAAAPVAKKARGAASTSPVRLSGATFSYPGGNEESMSPDTKTAVALRRPGWSHVVHSPHGLATAKEIHRRAASAGPTTTPASRAQHVPALSFAKLQQTQAQELAENRQLRGQQPTTSAAAAVALEPHVREDSLAISAPSLANLDEGPFWAGSAGGILADGILGINGSRLNDSDFASASIAAGTAMTQSWPTQPQQPRGASTPRAQSPRTDLAGLGKSPVNRALRSRTEASPGTTPRHSVSTPRFTVATNTSSLPYTARVSREGTPIMSSLTPAAAPPGAFSAALADAPQAIAPQRVGGSPTNATAPPVYGQIDPAFATEAFMKGDSQDYVAAVAEQVSRHYYVILTALDIGRGAALQEEPPLALCLRSMVIDLNTIASLLSYDSRNGIQDLLFEDCAFATVDFAWLSRLTHLSALRFKGPMMTTALVNRLVSHAPTVRTLTLIGTSRITSLESLVSPSAKVYALQLIQTDFSAEAYENVVNCASLRQIMLMQVQLRTNVFDLLNTNHIVELHLVGCPDIYYEDIPRHEWVSSCSPRHEDLAPPPPPPSDALLDGAGSRGSGLLNGSKGKGKKRKHQRTQPKPSFPLRAVVIADSPGLQLRRIPFADFDHLTELSVLYQRGVRAADLAGVLEEGRLTTLRLQEAFVDEQLIQRLQKCTKLQELNLSLCRGLRGIQQVWPALADTLRVLNVSFSDIDDAGLAGLCACTTLCNVYARGCAHLRSFDAFRQLPPSVGLIDLSDSSGMESDGFGEPFQCTGLHSLVLAGCTKVRTVSGIKTLSMLEELNLAGTGVDDSVFAALAVNTEAVVLQTITRLDLSGCRNINALTDFAATSRSALRNLTSLNLARSSINNSGLANIAQAVEGGSGCLSDLVLSYCTGISSLGPLGAVKSLRTLDASFSGVDDAGLSSYVAASVQAFNKELRVLELSGCTSLHDVGCLGQLPRLAVLHLSGSTVDGPASFEGVSRCAGLQDLDLSECMQIVSVVELVPHLTSLRFLNLSLTSISDDSVDALRGLEELEVLQLSGCSRVRRVAALAELSLLQRLNLSATGVTDLAPLAGCAQLWDLSVCSCAALTSLQPLASARMLQRLDASNTAVTSDSFRMPWECASLEELDVHGCAELRGIPAGALRKLVSLRRVNASDAGLDDSAVAALAECANLCDLQLSQCHITSLSPLGKAPTLQCLMAHNTEVADDGIAGLETSTTLRTLDLTGCRLLHDVSALRQVRSLAVLVLRDSGVQDVSFSTTWSRSGIRELNVSGCPNIKEPTLLRTMRGLEVFAAAGSGLSDAGLRMVAQCPALRRVNVADCGQVTDVSPLSMVDGLTHLDASSTPITALAPPKPDGDDTAPLTSWAETSHLRHLTLRSCVALEDVSALRHLTELYRADFSGSGVSEVSFVESWAACQSLEEAVLTNCADLHHVRGLWSAPHLMRLFLNRTAIDKVDGAEGCLPLEVLDISECKRLKDIACVRALPRLQLLQCRGSDITDDSFVQPWTAPNLLSVNLSNCAQVRDVGALGHLPRLRSGVFADTFIIDGAVRGLSRAPMMELLDLRGCSRLAHLGSLSRMQRIRSLYLSRTCIGNFTFSSVSRCKQLEVLEMEDCPYVTSVFVVFEFGQLRCLKFPPLSRMVGSVLHTCHSLEYLSLHGCPESFEIESLSILPRLKVLDLRESAIKEKVLAALNDCASLEEVDVSYCTELTSLDAMGRLPRLRCFVAAGLPITDDACEKLTEYPLLEKVVLAECHLLHDVSALQRLPQLHHLDISESGATEASFLGIREMRSLEELSVHGCKAIKSCRLLTEAPPSSPSSPSTPATTAAAVTVRLPRLRLVDLSGTSISRSPSSSAETAALRQQCPLLTRIYVDGTNGNSPVHSIAANIWRKLTKAA